MADENKFIKVIARLNALTQERKLIWESLFDPESLSLGRDKRVNSVYQTHYKNKALRIYEENYKAWYDEDRYTWASKVVLAFVDRNDQNAWEFPELPGLWDLLESVKYQETKVDVFVDEILSDENED